MSHYRSLDTLALQNAWLTIGVFDGVHRGHQEILSQLTAGAQSDGAPAVVLTFHPHPAVVLGGKKEFKCLTTPEERAALLESLGVDVVITHPFDRDLAAQTAEAFMRRLAQTLGLRRLLVGYDFALGRGREGNVSRLTELGKTLGYEVRSIPPVTNAGATISSTNIRRQVAEGDVSAAAAGLGRNYALTGPVIHGDGRGRKINIPTANLEIPAEKIIPANGVYACWAWVGGKKYRAVTNIGIRPTFTPEEFAPHVETHLLDFDRDLYDQELRLEFVERLREERKFLSVEALVGQIHADIGRARLILI
jgi:riboflavin kinase/FMN adenylyltransferase